MDILVERCAGLDVHKGTVAACVRIPGPDGGRQQLHTFKATTAGLLGLADWLESYGVTLVGMESTGVYWKPVVRHEVPRILGGGERTPPAACRSRPLKLRAARSGRRRGGWEQP